MIEVGLMPSDTGAPGGNIVGQHMSDYIIEGGPFLKAYNKLMESDFKIQWLDHIIIAGVDIQDIQEEHGEVVITFNPDNYTIGNPTGLADSHSLDAHPFSKLLNEMMSSIPTKKTRQRYVCSGCDSIVYGKPGLVLACVSCDVIFASKDF